LAPPFAVAEILLVSKPLGPPWNDGAKNLVRDLAEASHRYRFRCLVPKGVPAPGGHIAEPIYSGGGQYAPSLLQNLRVLARLAKPDDVSLYHFFFAPNPKTSMVASALMKLRRRPTVHTVVSKPSGRPPLFADVHIALSESTAATLRDLGARDVRVIPPGLPLEPPNLGERGLEFRKRMVLTSRRFQPRHQKPLVLFAGDLVAGGGARVFAQAAATSKAFHAVFACRPKGAGHAAERAAVQQIVMDASFMGQVTDMAALLSVVDVVCLPATNLLGKMDIPMVLLEALRLGKPVIVSDRPPLSELDQPGVIQVEPTAEALRVAIEDLLPATHAPTSLSGRYDILRMAAAYEDIYEELLLGGTKR
jgi:glycosyltransferase involved in cell wall biosynthesis